LAGALIANLAIAVAPAAAEGPSVLLGFGPITRS
jgi:hypothetical protein